MGHLWVQSSGVRLLMGKYKIMQVRVRSGVVDLELTSVFPGAAGSGLSRPEAGFTSTSPFVLLYIVQTLSDGLLDCRFSNCS